MNRRTLILATASLLLLGSVSAQSADAPPLSVELSKLYAHHLVSDTAELTGWVNTLEADGDDTAMGPSSSCTTHSGDKTVDDVILTAAGTALDRTYTFTILPAQTGGLVLDKAKMISNVYVGAGSCFGKLDITSTLLAGDVKVSEGKKTGHWYDNTAALYPGVTIESDILVTDEIALETLVWKVNLKGKTGGSAFMGVSKDKGMSGIALPIVSVGGAALPPIVQDIDEGFETELTFAEATTQSYQFNWTSPGGDATLDLSVALTNGSVDLLIMGGGKELANETLNGSVAKEYDFATTEGPYTIHLSFSKAVGSAKVLLSLAAPESAGGGGGLGTSAPASNETAAALNDTGEKAEEGVPVPAALAILAPLAAVLIWRRRNC